MKPAPENPGIIPNGSDEESMRLAPVVLLSVMLLPATVAATVPVGAGGISGNPCSVSGLITCASGSLRYVRGVTVQGFQLDRGALVNFTFKGGDGREFECRPSGLDCRPVEVV